MTSLTTLKRTNKAFSERHLDSVKNAPFLKIAIFHPIYITVTRHSLVENDRLPSLRGALDGLDSAPFLGSFYTQTESFSRSFIYAHSQATHTVRWLVMKLHTEFESRRKIGAWTKYLLKMTDQSETTLLHLMMSKP